MPFTRNDHSPHNRGQIEKKTNGFLTSFALPCRGVGLLGCSPLKFYPLTRTLQQATLSLHNSNTTFLFNRELIRSIIKQK